MWGWANLCHVWTGDKVFANFIWIIIACHTSASVPNPPWHPSTAADNTGHVHKIDTMLTPLTDFDKWSVNLIWMDMASTFVMENVFLMYVTVATVDMIAWLTCELRSVCHNISISTGGAQQNTTILQCDQGQGRSNPTLCHTGPTGRQTLNWLKCLHSGVECMSVSPPIQSFY